MQSLHGLKVKQYKCSYKQDWPVEGSPCNIIDSLEVSACMYTKANNMLNCCVEIA